MAGVLQKPIVTGGAAGATPPWGSYRWWEWVSTPESAARGIVTVLAVAETLAAMAIYVWIAVRWGTAHLVVAALVTPLLLLRTEHTIRLGLRWAFRSQLAVDWVWKRLPGLIAWPLIFFVVVPAWLLTCRTVAAIVSFLQHPVLSLRAIPDNWFRQTMCLDFAHPVEAMPGMLLAIPNATDPDEKDFLEFLTMKGLWENLREQTRRNTVNLLTIGPLSIVVGALVLLPAIAYRLSIKGTALVWSPTVWVVYSVTSVDSKSTLQELEGLRISGRYKFVLLYSSIVIGIVLGKLAFSSLLVSLSEWWNPSTAVKLLDAFIVPTEVPLWHVAALINALLSWLLWGVADWVFVRRRLHRPIPEAAIHVGVRLLANVRWALTVYTIVIGIYTAATLLPELSLPRIGTDIVPDGLWQWLRRTMAGS